MQEADRLVTDAETDYVTELFGSAFFTDPTWSGVFPDEAARVDQLRQFWVLLLHSAVPYESVFVTDDGSAATLWIPPGRPELSDADEERVEPLLRELVGDRTDQVLELLELFGSTHPAGPEHYYLSLLGTHQTTVGRGRE
jgi:hypothetical protein